MRTVRPDDEAALAILNAPFEPNGWAQALDKVAAACGGAGANLVGLGGPLALSLNLVTGRNSDRANRYFSNGELWGACNWRVNSAGPAMSIQHEAHYQAYRAQNDTAAYDDAVSDLDIQFGCQAPLISDSSTFVGIALFRGRAEGRCDEAALSRFSELSFRLRRSIRVELALQSEAAELMIGDAAASATATVLLDRFGCVGALTPAAEAMAEQGDPFRLLGLALQLSDRDDDRRLQSAMARLLAGAQDRQDGRVFEMRVGRSQLHPAGRWLACLLVLPRREHGLGFDPHFALTFRAI